MNSVIDISKLMFRTPAPTHRDDSLPFALRVGWGVGGLGSYTILSTSSLVLFYFMTTRLGIEAALDQECRAWIERLLVDLNPVPGDRP